MIFAVTIWPTGASSPCQRAPPRGAHVLSASMGLVLTPQAASRLSKLHISLAFSQRKASTIDQDSVAEPASPRDKNTHRRKPLHLATVIRIHHHLSGIRKADVVLI
jgi:hypothetical protein